jgi:hypothetical protein
MHAMRFAATDEEIVDANGSLLAYGTTVNVSQNL